MTLALTSLSVLKDFWVAVSSELTIAACVWSPQRLGGHHLGLCGVILTAQRRDEGAHEQPHDLEPNRPLMRDPEAPHGPEVSTAALFVLRSGEQVHINQAAESKTSDFICFCPVWPRAYNSTRILSIPWTFTETRGREKSVLVTITRGVPTDSQSSHIKLQLKDRVAWAAERWKEKERKPRRAGPPSSSQDEEIALYWVFAAILSLGA